jgi:hypothetical protein
VKWILKNGMGGCGLDLFGSVLNQWWTAVGTVKNRQFLLAAGNFMTS